MSFRKSLNLKRIAKEHLRSIDFWFRKKYNLSPKDPRYLNCESWEMEFEFELEQQSEEMVKKQIESHQKLCPNCNSIMQGEVCRVCGEKSSVKREIYIDPDFEEYEKAIEKENEDFFTDNKWEDIPEKDLEKLEEELS